MKGVTVDKPVLLLLDDQVWEDSDLVSIGELQLLWEDRSTNQTLGSLRLYYLPEYTQEGRLPEHGEVGTKNRMSL